MKDVIVEYFASPRRDKTDAIQKLSIDPDESFDALLRFCDPPPQDIASQDLPDYLSELFSRLILKFPRLLLDRDISELPSGARYFVISAAIATASPIFAPVILNALNDRVADKRFLAVKAIARFKFLQNSETRIQLKRLLTLKSMEYCRKEIQEALTACEETERNEDSQ